LLEPSKSHNAHGITARQPQQDITSFFFAFKKFTVVADTEDS
jgi:hypothetical protein